jgi:arylsulfatase A-like enzyme
VTRAGTTSSFPTVSTDHYPTLLELAGLAARPAQHMDGVSLAGVLAGRAAPRRPALFWHYPHNHGSAWAPGAALRAGDWKLIEFYEEGTAELYNLRDDLGERNDLAGKMPAETRKLREQLRAWQKSVGAKMAQPNPAYRKPGD